MSSRDIDPRITEAVASIDPDQRATYVREVTTGLVEQFAFVSGDDHPLHVDEEYARSQHYGRVVAHGAMLVGFMSTASTLLSRRIEEQIGYANVSLGYDRLRFVAPVFAGDTITTRITIRELQPERARVICEEICVDQDSNLVAVGVHVMRFV